MQDSETFRNMLDENVSLKGKEEYQSLSVTSWIFIFINREELIKKKWKGVTSF